MLVVKIELHSAITGQVTTLATGKIVNTGSGSPTRGNYRVELRDAAGRVWKTGHIEDFPRKRLLAWDLLYRALGKLIGARNTTPKTVPARGLTSRQATPTQPRGTNNDRATAQSE